MPAAQQITNEDFARFKDSLRKEATERAAKWAIGAVVALLGFAVAGWWLYLEPRLKNYISNAAGGVPAGAIIVSSVECKSLSGKFEPFTEGTGRFLVGAGTDFHNGYINWTSEGGASAKLSQYKIMDLGGEERHLIKVAESPQIIPKIRSDYGGNHDTGGTERVDVKQQTATMNVLPPYVAVFFCKKK